MSASIHTSPLSLIIRSGRNVCSPESASGEVAAQEIPTIDRPRRRTIETQMMPPVIIIAGRRFFSAPIISSISGIVDTPLSE